MLRFQDYRLFRFRSRDHGRGSMTSSFDSDINIKSCIIKWLTCDKRIPSYATNNFLTNGPERYVWGPLNKHDLWKPIIYNASDVYIYNASDSIVI